MDRMKFDDKNLETITATINARFKHYPPRNQWEIRIHENIREIVRGCAMHLVSTLPSSCVHTREFSLVLTKLEEVMFHANAAYARNKPTEEDDDSNGVYEETNPKETPRN